MRAARPSLAKAVLIGAGLLLPWVAGAQPAPARAPASEASVAAPAQPAASAPPATARAAPAPRRVEVPSADGGLRLPGYWFAAATPRGPAVVGLHGCDGLGARNGRLGAGRTRYAQLLNEAGIGLLFIESFQPRGEASICSQKREDRRITEAHRRLDVDGALAWLAEQPGIDARRLGVVGWSHGGQTVLAVAERAPAQRSALARPPAALVAFYPGCTQVEKQASFEPLAPLLVMSGALDDWTPAAPCRRLVQRLAGRPGVPAVEYIEFPDSYHGFDAVQPPRPIENVGGTRSGRATVGGNPAAREASAQALMRFLGQHLKP